MKVPLHRIAHARSGDKGDGSNVGVFVTSERDYAWIREQLTAERVKQHFHAICKGEVTRYEAPNMLALNFLLRDSLGGGGSESLKTDAQGKTHGQGILQLAIEVPDQLVPPERVMAAAPQAGPAAGGPATAAEAPRPGAGSGSPEALKGL